MTRLIDANALHEKFYDLTKFKQDKHTGDWVSQRSVKISDALRMINDAPTVKIKDIIVRCKDCVHQEHCHETVAHTRIHDDFKEHWSEQIEWCSRGERKGGDSE